MKKAIIIFNITFLLFGNLIFSNLHFLHHHDIEGCSHSHDEKTFKYEECLDCITFDNNNDFNFINDKLITSSKFIHDLILDPESFTENNFNKNYSTRAPPFS